MGGDSTVNDVAAATVSVSAGRMPLIATMPYGRYSPGGVPASGRPGPAPLPPPGRYSRSTWMMDLANGRSLPLRAWQLCAEEIKHACFSNLWLKLKCHTVHLVLF